MLVPSISSYRIKSKSANKCNQPSVSFGTRNHIMMNVWNQLANDLGVRSSLANATYKNLEKGYSSQGRAYHVLPHVEDCLNELEEYCSYNRLAVNPTDRIILKLAIWFHDYKDERFSQSAIADSAKSAAQFLKHSTRYKSHSPLLKDLIMATDYSKPASTTSEKKCLLDLMRDIDLVSLSYTPQIVLTNSQALALESQAAGRSLKQHVTSQNHFLDILLQQKNIYQTKWFQDRYEAIARKNIQTIKSEIKA